MRCESWRGFWPSCHLLSCMRRWISSGQLTKIIIWGFNVTFDHWNSTLDNGFQWPITESRLPLTIDRDIYLNCLTRYRASCEEFRILENSYITEEMWRSRQIDQLHLETKAMRHQSIFQILTEPSHPWLVRARQVTYRNKFSRKDFHVLTCGIRIVTRLNRAEWQCYHGFAALDFIIITNAMSPLRIQKYQSDSIGLAYFTAGRRFVWTRRSRQSKRIYLYAGALHHLCALSLKFTQNAELCIWLIGRVTRGAVDMSCGWSIWCCRHETK
jgi:hypothetical protein